MQPPGLRRRGSYFRAGIPDSQHPGAKKQQLLEQQAQPEAKAKRLKRSPQASQQVWQRFQKGVWLFPCFSRMKTGCVTLGQLLTLSGYRSLSGAVCWKPSPRPVEEFGPPPGHTQGSRAASLPLLGSDKAENFLVFIWFSFECFQRQRGRSTKVPRKLVHVGRSLPENEVICSFFIFCCLSPSARVTRPLQSLPAKTRPASGSAGLAGGRSEERTPRAGAARGAPSPPPISAQRPPPVPTRDFPGTARKNHRGSLSCVVPGYDKIPPSQSVETEARRGAVFYRSLTDSFAELKSKSLVNCRHPSALACLYDFIF
ncbi:uncharacterized protein LOC132491577 [Mesoplodon densirostris]|uniref:uncharacterized protein LOC132491577 n=1 Tax=Mesoplodon densirostris TaxID=48708 RepID=UPI0028DC2183|nr:uncharacterized protein LOC132491577 [Mesoplodon densirostris]